MTMRKFMNLIVVALIASLAAVPARGVAQVPAFNTVIATPTGSQPWQPPRPAAVGDFSGDGKLDALIVDGSPSARFMRGNGDGTFAEINIGAAQMTTSNMVGLPGNLAQYMPKSIDGYMLIKAADVNGDGKLDAICATTVHINWGPYSLVTVLINTGNDANGVPQFSTTNYFLGFYDVRSLTVGDLNGDGKPDIIVGSAYAGLYIYRNNGDGTFTPGQVTSIMPNAGGPAVGAGVITDVNGDGKADFVVTSGQANATDVFLGNGDGTLQAPSIVSPAASCIAVADLNKDGKPDLIEGLGDGSVSVYLGNGNGTFGSPANFPSGATSWPSGFFISDVNGDGNLDVAASLPSIAKVAILTGNGHGTLSSPYLYGAIPNAVDVTLADFTGDGKPDIASVSPNGYGGQNFDVLTNTTTSANRPPVAVAGADQSFTCVVGSAKATLDGSGSSDPDGNKLTYSWSLGGSVVSTSVSFTTSLGEGTFIYTLTVSDGLAQSSAKVTVTVALDKTPPVLTVPPDIAETANTAGGYSGSVGTATAVDGCGGPVTITSNAPTVFPLGVTTVQYTARDIAGNASTGTQKVTVKPYPILVDIKPGSSANVVNFKNKGVIPVSVYSTSTFDATSLDVSSLRFGPGGAVEAHGMGHYGDLNGDGLTDVMLHFDTQASGLTNSDVSATLVGKTLSGIPVAGSDVLNVGGSGKSLDQNYPNPFNPATQISFTVPVTGQARLVVVNSIGQEVATLFDSMAEPGRRYTVTFDGLSLPSGIYIYRLSHNGTSFSKKMLLVK